MLLLQTTTAKLFASDILMPHLWSSEMDTGRGLKPVLTVFGNVAEEIICK